MSTILTTVDGSAESESILPVVRRLAKEMQATIQLLTVVEPVSGTRTASQPSPQALTQGWGPGVAPFSVAVYPEQDRSTPGEWTSQAIARVEAKARAYLEEVASPLTASGLVVNVTVVMHSDPGAAIIEFAEKSDVALIAMATHGRSGLNRLIQGSVAAEVVRSGVAPTLLIRPPQR